ncbi:DHH family phosphoesterase [uncultured Umboniibacter sp.]|uniref:DHH family phosphoesterase n=1 Tax=uncultured Umboniibacter sp. TaxID=1798917 RepID=UPI0026039FB3|nr:DHH family phosphoesterase [uncultured Umboniibacter sp.]
MAHYDVFNGDADGILSLVQLRLAHPTDSVLITGVKRDISLLKQVSPDLGDTITVLDISMEKNAEALDSVLDLGAEVTYVDHHRSGHIPAHGSLSAHINLDANTCTALIVDEILQGTYHAWAIAAAYGDNLVARADELATVAEYDDEQRQFLKELGTLVNYNGYGERIDDLHFHPAELFKRLVTSLSPFELREDQDSVFYELQTAYKSDMAELDHIEACYNTEIVEAFRLPHKPWAKRVSGVFGNELANSAPNRAHVVFSDNSDGTLMVSLRAPLNNKQGAGDICSQFPTGGGRAAAAGVNKLPEAMMMDFLSVVERYYT